MNNFEFYIKTIISFGLPLYGLFKAQHAAQSMIAWNKLIKFELFSEKFLSILIRIVCLILLAYAVNDIYVHDWNQ